jgi:hypothetical protein
MERDQNQKKDADKKRWDLLPIPSIESIVDVLSFGAKKYSPGGWRTVDEWRPRYYAAALRHMFAWWRGEKTDSESGLPHLSHALCCLVFLWELDAPAFARPFIGEPCGSGAGPVRR